LSTLWQKNILKVVSAISDVCGGAGNCKCTSPSLYSTIVFFPDPRHYRSEIHQAQHYYQHYA
jgi:hypothetical protein